MTTIQTNTELQLSGQTPLWHLNVGEYQGFSTSICLNSLCGVSHSLSPDVQFYHNQWIRDQSQGTEGQDLVPWMRTCEGNTRIFGGLQVTELFLQHWQNTEPRDVSSHCVLLNASESTVSIILWHSPSAAALQTPSSPGLPSPTSIFN